MLTFILYWLVIPLLLTVGAVMGAMGAGAQFRELIIQWVVGVWLVIIVIVVGLALSVWNAWVGLIFIIVVGLYVVDWMIHS